MASARTRALQPFTQGEQLRGEEGSLVRLSEKIFLQTLVRKHNEPRMREVSISKPRDAEFEPVIARMANFEDMMLNTAAYEQEHTEVEWEDYVELHESCNLLEPLEERGDVEVHVPELLQWCMLCSQHDGTLQMPDDCSS